jgi:tetratricopeptide (TPR) repeat protein
MTANDFKGALESAMKAKDKSPEIDSNWITLAEVYLRSGQKPDSLAAIRKAVDLNPSNKNQLPLNRAFESLKDDPEFKKIMAK